MGRFSDIRRGKELNEALTKLRAWEDLTRAQKQALYKQQRGTSVRVKARRTKGYVESFGLVGRIYLPVRLLDNNQTGSTQATLISTVRTAAGQSDRTKASDFTSPQGGVLLDGLKGYKPAKLSLTDRGTALTDNKSRVTEVEYQRYDTKTVSSPFGAKSDTETYDQAVSEIGDQEAIKSFLTSDGNRIAFTPEVL
ncbi:hypothetical protein [Anabaena azotica]|uniref:CpcD n=1 Tax=Anabaena azotica FACHB-119 TaxID=947527 RepID=A0ABR8D9M0_9NOST|nr:hypothetical protein [Anabaena azotica]MBD2503128.1 hypothetical protein [Anabaena azotica FACHB-119]